MTKPRPLLCGFILIILLLAALTVNFYAPVIDREPPQAAAKLQEPMPEESETLTMQAEAFSSYGWDADGIDYGPGYAIISTGSEIPLYSLLEIDQYGEAQAIAVSDELAADEIKLWYNAPSKVPMFGRQTVQVTVKEKGDTPWTPSSNN